MLPAGHPLLTLAVVLIAGVASGWAVRRTRVPAMTGQILVGIALGPSVLGLVSAEALHDLRPLTHFALGLIAVAVGNHLSFRRLRNAWGRLSWLVAFEATLTPGLVFAALVGFGLAEWPFALLLSAMAIATAPATIVGLVRECRAKGVFVKTLVAGVALNNLVCILLFEMAHAAARLGETTWRESDVVDLLAAPLGQLVATFAIGGVVGIGLVVATARIARSDLLVSASMIAILLTSGLAEFLAVSPLLSCLFLGLALANITPDKDEIGHRVFQDFEDAIFAVFFTLAGMELDFAYLVPGGLVALVFVAARFVGKMASAGLAMQLAGATASVRRYLGLALVPQAGVAIGLVLLVQEDRAMAGISQLFLAVGIASVAINEIIGPITTRLAIGASGEVGRDRPRLIDFLHEEHIVVGLDARTLPEAIEGLVDHLLSSHRVDADRSSFLRAVLDGEALGSSALGHGLAIPHARLPSGGGMVGVMGISPEGIPAPTPDGRPVHCIVLLATPEGQQDRHLEVLAALAKAIDTDPNIRDGLYHARSPAHAYELLHAEDAEDFNYFLEDEDGEDTGARRSEVLPSRRGPPIDALRRPADGPGGTERAKIEG